MAATEVDLMQAVERAEQSGTTAQLANALDHLAAQYHHDQRYADAAPVYARALGMWRQILGAEHPSVGTLLVNLGNIYLHLGDIGAAEPVFRQALGIFENDVDVEDDGIVEALTHFAETMRHQGRHDDAERFAARVRKIESLVHETVRA